MHTYIHTYMNTHIHTYIHAYIHTYMNTHMHTHIHIHTYIHTYIYHVIAFVHIHTCIQSCIYTYIHSYTFTHIHTYMHRGVTDDGLGFLVDRSPSLRKLVLRGCSQITDIFLNGHSGHQELVIWGRDLRDSTVAAKRRISKEYIGSGEFQPGSY